MRKTTSHVIVSVGATVPRQEERLTELSESELPGLGWIMSQIEVLLVTMVTWAVSLDL